jgi:hypothetical protein
LAAYKAGRCSEDRAYRSYIVLGDDIVLGHSDVADEYVGILKRLGMKVKIEDSFTPVKRSKPIHLDLALLMRKSQPHLNVKFQTSLELAKRLYRDGSEITPYPLSLLDGNPGLF